MGTEQIQALVESQYEKVPAFRRTILHVINAPDSGVLLTVAVIVKRQTSVLLCREQYYHQCFLLHLMSFDNVRFWFWFDFYFTAL